MMGLMLVAPHARAGSYVGAFVDPASHAPTQYSGGTYYALTTYPPAAITYGTVPDTVTSGSYGGDSNGYPGRSDCSYPISTSWKWVPAAGLTMTSDPPPAQVIILQTCSVYVSIGHVGASGTYKTGLGKSGGVSLNPPGSSGIGSAADTVYSVVAGGASVSLPSLDASATVPAAPSESRLSYTASIFPVTINPFGATSDGNGGWVIMIGQHCSASLSGIPSALLNNTANPPKYQWSVSGTTFQTWSADTPPFPVIVGGVQIGITPENPDATYEVDGPGPLTNPTAGWYWNDLAKGTGNSTQETVSCTATVTPPAGQGAAFTVTATQPVTVWTPVWTATGEGASVVVNNKYHPPDFWLCAGPGPLDFGATRGMTWDATVAPPPAPILFGLGSLVIVQVITAIDEGATLNTTPPLPIPYPNNGQTGLDTSWPYGWSISTSITGGMKYESGDSPGLDVNSAKSAHDNISFEDYLMYCPPSSVQYVPVAKYIWNVSMGASLPATGNWINFTGTAGTVTDAQKTGHFLPNNQFPAWTQILTGNQ